MCRFVLAFLLLAAVPQPGACREAQESAGPFLLDEALRWEGGRHNTLGPTGKRLFTERIEEAPGFQGVFSYLHATPGFRDPLSLSFCDEEGALPARHVRTVWRPSHLEVRWLLDGRVPGGAGGGIEIIERKFITADDVLVDCVRAVNGNDHPVSIEARAAGAMTPLPERFRSRQVLCDLSPTQRLDRGRGALLPERFHGE